MYGLMATILLMGGVSSSIQLPLYLHIIQMILKRSDELDMDSPKNSEAGNSSRLVPPQEACNRIVQVVEEAVQKMELVADETMRMLKKARIALEVCDNELEEKAKEVAKLKLERQQKMQQIDELDSIVRLKEAEADMFQVKADEATREADRLQVIALSKMGKSEDDYTSSRYLQQRLSEAEAEKQYLVEKIKLGSRSSQGNDNGTGEPSQALLSKIQEILKSV